MSCSRQIGPARQIDYQLFDRSIRGLSPMGTLLRELPRPFPTDIPFLIKTVLRARLKVKPLRDGRTAIVMTSLTTPGGLLYNE